MNFLLGSYLCLTMPIGTIIGATASILIVNNCKDDSSIVKTAGILGITCISTLVFPVALPFIVYNNIQQGDSFNST